MKKVLVTGAKGYLGNVIANALSKSEHEVYCLTRTDNPFNYISCDLTSFESLNKALESVSFDTVIHCAGVVQGKNNSSLEKDYSINNQMMKNLLSCTSSKIIYCSSMTVYGDNVTGYINEVKLTNPESKYASSKYNDEVMLIESDNPYLILRLPGLFGAGRKSGIIFNAIASLLMKKNPDIHKKLTAWSAIHVEDAANIIIKLMEKRIDNEIFNISYGVPQSIYRLINFIKELMEMKKIPELELIDNWVCLDNSKLVSYIGDVDSYWEMRLKDEIKIIRNIN